jgi:hypothetical protein
MFKKTIIHNTVVEWLALLFHIREIPDSNISLETGYPEIFLGFSESLQVNVRLEP